MYTYILHTRARIYIEHNLIRYFDNNCNCYIKIIIESVVLATPTSLRSSYTLKLIPVDCTHCLLKHVLAF